MRSPVITGEDTQFFKVKSMQELKEERTMIA